MRYWFPAGLAISFATVFSIVVVLATGPAPTATTVVPRERALAHGLPAYEHVFLTGPDGGMVILPEPDRTWASMSAGQRAGVKLRRVACWDRFVGGSSRFDADGYWMFCRVRDYTPGTS